MKKFGLKKDESDDSSRNRLFGSKSKSSNSTVPASSNPYAIPPQGGAPPDPYAQPSRSPYQNTDSYGGLGAPSYGEQGRRSPGPPSYDAGGYGGGLSERARREKSPVPPGGYGSGRYGDQGNYGNRGYGSDNRFGKPSGPSHSDTSSSLGPSGYGGLGRTPSHDTMSTDAGRDALFGGAKDRYKQKQAQSTLPPEQDPAKGGSYGESSWNGAAALGEGGQGYGAYQERELTAEEEEEQDVQATKDQIKFIKQQDVSSTRNALRIAQQAEETGRATLERLGQQGERIHNTEKNLDLAQSQNRAAEEKAREIKHLNRSLWSVQVRNPFTKDRRERDRDDAIIEKHLQEKEARESTRAATYESQRRQQEHERQIRSAEGVSIKKGNLAERSKYQFEADSEDEQMEDEIDSNLDALSGAAGRLNLLGRAMGSEVDKQNEHISRIGGKADDVDLKLTMNRARLDRIK